MGESRSAFKMLTSKPTKRERERPQGRPRRCLEENVKMDLKEIGVNTSNWIDSAQDRDL